MSKGKRRERQAAELYERAGYETFRTQESKFGETDMFGLFDGVAIGAEASWWFQVKANMGNTGLGHFFDEAPDLLPEGHIATYMVCVDREGWRLAVLGMDGEYLWVVDERNMDCRMGEGVVGWLSDQ